jgi:hypothetical protein
MMFRGLIAFVLLSCCAAFGQATGTARINFVADDAGLMWVNGNPVTVDTATWIGSIPIRQGKNVFAAYVWDSCWTGGFCASIDAANGVDTPATDGTWKCTDFPVAGGGTAWQTDTNFDDASWFSAGDYGVLADSLGNNAKRLFTNNGLKVAQMYYDHAHWVWGPKHVYFRKSFNVAAASNTATVFLKGNGFTYNVYLNGTQIMQSNTMLHWGSASVQLAGQAVRAGENVLAVEGVVVDSIDFAWFKSGIRGAATVSTDTSWRMTYTQQAGWNTFGFDASTWRNAGYKDCQYDGVTDAMSAVKAIWSTRMAFRTVFTIRGGLGTAPQAKVMPAAGLKVLRTEYYNLRGERLSAAQMGMLKSNSMVVERQFISNGSSVSRTIGAGK